MKNRKLKLISCLCLSTIVIIVLILANNYNKKNNIDFVLKREYYAYLPQEAKNYIKKVYEKTGSGYKEIMTDLMTGVDAFLVTVESGEKKNM